MDPLPSGWPVRSIPVIYRPAIERIWNNPLGLSKSWIHCHQVGQCIAPRSSVAAAKADVFRKNGISVGKKYAKILKIFDNIGHVKKGPLNIDDGP